MTRLLIALLLGVSLWAQRVPPRFYEFKPLVTQVTGDRWPDRAAQIWAESGFNPLAVSPVGAKGLGQAMDATWGDYRKNGWVTALDSPFHPVPAVTGQHRYMLQIEGQMRHWMGPVPKDGGWFDASLAGYNAGSGNIKRCFYITDQLGIPTTEWKRVLVRVTGPHSKETLDYIPRAFAYRAIVVKL